MKNSNLFPFERNRYFYGKMLTARDLEAEQNYINNKRRLINRVAFGAGVACGLGVYKNDDSSISLETGLALDYLGREIVISSPMIRTLRMLEGYENLSDNEFCYLCMTYDEAGKEPINNIGVIDRNSEQFNKIEECPRLYLDVSEPNWEVVYGEGGNKLVSVLYSKKGVTIIQIVPSTILSGNTFELKFIVIKPTSCPPINFDLEFTSDFFSHDEKLNILISYNEFENQCIQSKVYQLKAKSAEDIVAPLASSQLVLSLDYAETSKRFELNNMSEIFICKDIDSYNNIKDLRQSTLQNRLYGGETPIYLAKIDYASAGNIHMIRQVINLPFDQKASMQLAENNVTVISERSFPVDRIETEVNTLKYWQKPEVYITNTQNQMKFHFGLPSAEAYDYATSTGLLKIPIYGAIKVNARFFSDEIPHNLGIGDVSISLSVEFDEGEKRRLLFGDGEVFGSKDYKDVPKVQTAALLYPEKGTFKVGVWCSDYVEGQSITIRWFAYKATRDVADMRRADTISIKIVPEIQKIPIRSQLHLKATVTGTADKTVTWAVKDADGGTIDANGIYNAPTTPGTYEITAQSNYDQQAIASAFVIVEETY